MKEGQSYFYTVQITERRIAGKRDAVAIKITINTTFTIILKRISDIIFQLKSISTNNLPLI